MTVISTHLNSVNQSINQSAINDFIVNQIRTWL